MDKFFIYLLESGICLSMFYLGYVFLFRKETYFTFNRIYLLLSVVLSVGIPMVHWGINIKPEAPLAKQMQQITEFKYTYEKLISLTDPDFAMPAVDQHKEVQGTSAAETTSNFTVPIKKPKERWFRIILGIYFAGLVFFLLRLIYLLFWLYRYSGRLEKSTVEGVHVLQVPNKLPSFSFFNYVFINKSLLTPDELAQVIAHEKVHVQQKHSVDLLIAHVITIFQWFNPLVWRIQKSMKTVHEYLADREVLRQGFELFDYQSLLLSQLISIRSVELVNNFNLLSIKKRIAMMNKIKSGFTAKLKALFAIPIITAIFLLFANFSFEKSASVVTNEKSVELTGSWMSVKKDAPFAQFIEFKDGKVHTLKSITGNGVIFDDYALKIKKNWLILHSDKKSLKLKYELSVDHIRIWWDENTVVEYVKSPEHMTYILVGMEFAELKRPQIVLPRKFDYNSIQIRIYFDKKDFYINEKRCTGEDFENELKSAITKCGEKEQIIMASLDIHADAQMKDVNLILSALRNNEILKIGYIAEPADKKKYNTPATYGISRLLPPKDRDFTLTDQADLEKKGVKFYNLDISADIPDIQKAKSELKEFIEASKKYVIKMVYSNNTSYNAFIEGNDMVNIVVDELRKEYAQSKYSKDFESLSEEKQDEIKEIYPMALITAMN
jgi:biopolymer transport protein ExbD